MSIARMVLVMGALLGGSPAFAEVSIRSSGRTALVDRSMNPAISVNGLFLGSYGSALDPAARGLAVQEIELALTAAVDPYLLGNVILAMHGPDFHAEEAYARTLNLPWVTLTAGKFYGNFGKNNVIHSHAQPLIDRPAANRMIFGEEGFQAIGIEVDTLIPLPWYFDTALTLFSAADTNTPLKASEKTELGVAARVEQLWDLSDATTLGWGLSGLAGRNQFAQETWVLGTDLTLKYIQPRGRGTFGLQWVNELLYNFSNYRGATVTTTLPAPWMQANQGERSFGLYSMVLLKASQQWWFGGRIDYVQSDLTQPVSPNLLGENLIVALVPSEFSTVRLQTGFFQPNNQASIWQVYLQLNITIGSHPAHAY